MRKFYWLIVLFVSISYAQAQRNFVSGYIVTLSGDSLLGKIDNQEPTITPNSVRFLDTITHEVNQYSAHQLRAFGIYDARERYESHEVSLDITPVQLEKLLSSSERTIIPDTTLFLSVLVTGKIKLLSCLDAARKLHLYIQKDTDSLTELIRHMMIRQNAVSGVSTVVEDRLYKIQLANLLQDCPTVSQLNKLPYQTDPIKAVVIQYNQCYGGSQFLTSSTKAATHIELSIQAGLAYHHESYDNFFGKSKITASPSFGLRLLKVIPRNRGHWALGVETKWHQITLKTTRNTSTPPEELISRATFIKINPFIRYTLLPGLAVKPYIQIAYCFTKGLNATIRSSTVMNDPPNFPFVLTEGPLLGIGVQYRRWWSQINYERFSATTTAYFNVAPIRSFGITVGYTITQ